MQLVLIMVIDFFLTATVGKGSSVALNQLPGWQRGLLSLLALVILLVIAFVVIALGYFVVGFFRGLSS